MKSDKSWLKEHFNDPYVKQSQKEGYRSRAVYKLKEIQEKDRLIKPDMTVVDLGAAPGGWSQIAVEYLHKRGKLVALDILPMDPIPGVIFIQGDFEEQAVLDQLLTHFDGEQADVVISDMLPNMSGMRSVDQPRMMSLCDLALDCAEKILKPGGSFVVKIFQGEGFEAYLKKMRGMFEKVVTRKPKASRDRSRECYLVGKGRR